MKREFKIFTIFLLLFLFIPNVLAASGSFSASGANIYINGSTDITITVNTSGDIQGVDGVVDVTDASCLRINRLTYIHGDGNGNQFAYVANSIIPSGTSVVKVNVTGLKTCQARVTISGHVVSASEGDIATSASSGVINVTEPPSDNNNLAGLTVSQGSITFDKNNTNYTINVEPNITSINIEATKEDGGASISGTGNKNLNYGNNKFDIVVTAANGSKKTYVVNVNRRDDRSDNALLSGLSISGVEMNPRFSSGVVSYDISVPYSVSSLSINATPADSKSKISINNNSLVAEEVTDVTIVVTAERGNSKTYVIHAKRGKDPNKVLSTVKNLTSINVSSGVLSPSFSKDQYKYIVYVPYEVEKLNIDVTLEDTRYGVLTKEGPEKLSVGNNEYRYIVKAEDESTQIYTIIVSRGISLTEQNLSNNNYLSNIKLTNGSLKEDFNKETYIYHYKRKNNFAIETTPDEEEAEVSIIDSNKIVNILVKAETGDIRIYTLVEDSLNILHFILIILIIVAFVIGFTIGVVIKANNVDKVKLDKEGKIKPKKKGNIE